MKKTLRSIIALMILLCTVFAISSCVAQPPKDLETAADNFEDADYDVVMYYDDADDIYIAGVVEYLLARENEKDGETLYIYVFETAKAAKLYYNTLKLGRDHEIESIKNSIESYKAQIKYMEYILENCDDDLSKSEIESYEDRIESYEEDIEEMMEELEELKKEYVLGISGKTVWYGTKQAIKDAKG